MKKYIAFIIHQRSGMTRAKRLQWIRHRPWTEHLKWGYGDWLVLEEGF